MEKINKQKVKKIAGTVGNVLIWVILIFSLLTTIVVFSAQGSQDGVPSVFGKSWLTIETPSMEPTYKVNDLVFMDKIAFDQIAALEPDAIITYHAPIDINGDGQIGDINTHRVVSNDPTTMTLVTKGDHNDLPDNEGMTPYTVRYADVIGTCREDGRLGGIGGVIKFLRSSVGFLICIVLPLVLFFLYELYNFISIITSERAKRQAAGVAKETEEEIKRRAIEEYLKKQAEEAANTNAPAEATEEPSEENTSDEEK